jgi:hypothetical protein
MLHNELRDRIQFRPAEAAGSCESDRIEPELRDHVFTAHMNVRRLAAVQRNKEETVAEKSAMM